MNEPEERYNEKMRRDGNMEIRLKDSSETRNIHHLPFIFLFFHRFSYILARSVLLGGPAVVCRASMNADFCRLVPISAKHDHHM